MNGCVMPAPAPCANTQAALGASARSSSAETLVLLSMATRAAWAFGMRGL
jgi:hypothetical protein